MNVMQLSCVTALMLLVGWQEGHQTCKQEGLAVASIAQDDLSTLPGDDPFPRARMHCNHNAW